jgi:hypothetical protein
MRKRNRGVEIKGTEDLFNVLESKVISQRPCEKNEKSPHY